MSENLAYSFSPLKRPPAYQVVSEKMREAIRLLEQSGLLGRAGRKRLTVRLPTLESASRSISAALQMHRVTFKDLWEVSMGLEPLAARLACATIDDTHKLLLAKNLERTRAALDDDEELLEAEIEFHDLVAHATRNHALLLARQPLNQLFYPAYRPVIEGLKPGKRILESHQRIHDAILADDPDTAARWAEKHMLDFRRGILMAKLDFEGPVSPLEDLGMRANRLS